MKMIAWNKIVIAVGISVVAMPVLADENMAYTNQWSGDLTSQRFISDAAAGGMKEVFVSQMALDKSTNAQVKMFAHRMIKDHSAANNKLMKIAQKEGLDFPATNMFSADDANWNNPMLENFDNAKGTEAQLLMATNFPYLMDYQAVKHLQSLTGYQFDQAYLSDMVRDHVQAVNEFQMASQNLADPELKKFAKKTLPTLRKHSKMAQELDDKYGMSGDMDMSHEMDMTNHSGSLTPPPSQM